MSDIPFTPQQRLAIQSAGQSAIVSAAAGSGKTAVLAERCAYLVCDAPEGVRCNADELLVLTFTEAAAAEMRSRIVDAIRGRAQREPRNVRLREQAARADAAQISTIHSFCLWLIRRWFTEAGIDPSATVLDEKETLLWKKDAIDELFANLYAELKTPGDPLGGKEAGGEQEFAGDGLSDRFARLVNDYGLGDDRSIAEFVLRLSNFVESLPAPEHWLRRAVDRIAITPRELVLESARRLREELTLQREHCQALADRFVHGGTRAVFYGERVLEHADQLHRWLELLAARGIDEGSTLAAFDAVRLQISEYKLASARPPKSERPETPLDSEAKDAWEQLREKLVNRRLKEAFGTFSVEEWEAGCSRIAPYAQTLVDLTLAYRDAFSARKLALNAMEFADLERLAFNLLRDPHDAEGPSEIARALHRRFAYVLVDEFQDVNPLQFAILRLASRESDAARDGNLFCVGDVKQSIYRFRLAEPTVFSGRLRAFQEGGMRGAAISLQRNFRSRPGVLEAVNLLFSRLMRFGDVTYDDEALLRPGRERAPGTRASVELHVLERGWDGHFEEPEEREDAESDEVEDPQEPDESGAEAGLWNRGVGHFSDPSRWSAIEREAYLIGSRIQDWRRRGEAIIDGQPPRYRDIAVLVRAARINAERMVAMFQAMSIPAFADAGASLFGALEVRDVLAALQLMDNAQQDIPLAAVLRSGVLASPLTEDDLVEIRVQDREVSFHEAFAAYADRGSNAALRERVCHFQARLNDYRAMVRRRPLAEVLWKIYHAEGHLARVAGLPIGQQRVANLLKLHDLAQAFASFRRQGLYRFLRFVESLEDDDQRIAAAPAIGESEDVVRVMTIHKAKGLEFPVVFVAGLGTRFNLEDRRGRMIFSRRAGLGLRAVEPERLIEYPTVAHRLVATEIVENALAEERRVLYVAMTRARERLVLVGSARKASDRLAAMRSQKGGPTELELSIATTPLDWLLPLAVPASRDGGEAVPGSGERALFDVRAHDSSEMAGWRVAGGTPERSDELLTRVSRREPLPAAEPLIANDAEVEDVVSRVTFAYPFLSLAGVGAAAAASEFRGSVDYATQITPLRSRAGDSEIFERSPAPGAAMSAAQRGTLTHRVMQRLDFPQARNPGGVALELCRLVNSGLLSEREKSAIDVGSIEWFVMTPLGSALAAASDTYRREFPFIAAESPLVFDRMTAATDEDFVLVRGIVDGMLPVGDGLELVDFKTDLVDEAGVADRSQRYRPQMAMYARAMARLWTRPVVGCHLVFLSARRIVRISGAELSSLTA